MNSQTFRMRRSGMLLIWFVILLAALMAFVSLGVDLGRVQLAKTELQRAADAAARYAVKGLSDSSYQSKAQVAAAANDCLGSSVDLLPADVETGTWANATFTPGGASPNAVRITARRVASRGSAVPLLFAQVIGIGSCDVHAISIAKREGIAAAFIGLDGIDVKNNLFVASYDSAVNPNPSQSNHQNNGMLGSNSHIGAKNNEVVGRIVMGPGGTHNLDPSTPVTILDDPISFAAPDFSGAPASNPNGTPQNLNVAGTVSLPGGTYYFTSISFGNNAHLSFSGPATLYIDGDVTFSQNGSVTAHNDLPANLRIRQRGAGSKFGGSNANSVEIVADIEAPETTFEANNSAVLMGRAIFKFIDVQNNLELYYDLPLENYLVSEEDAGLVALVQ